MTGIRQFNVSKRDLATVEVTEVPLPSHDALPEDALLVKIDRFAFTANNITYAMLGDALKYWQLFPAPEGFGNVPVWGFGEVIASKHPQIETGERLFGYFPMATHLVIEAADVSKRGLRDGAAQRQGVAPVYNAYARVSDDPAFTGRNGDYQALLRALFMLSFLVDDFLAEAEFFGARQVILSSASSKTAFGLAHLLHTKRQPIRVVGLTSHDNADFVASLGCYHEVVPYDRVDSLPAEQPTAFVDMAGNADLRARLHRHFKDNLVYSGRIGMTHQDTTETDGLPGVKPSWFFAPDQIRKRAKEWGPGGIDTRFGAAWADFLPMLETSLAIVEGHGLADVERVYRATLAGKASPREGHLLSLFER
ncbi:DUF2855 family protein [Tardiphaga alba]|uniref:DUF2855 family protein n=1 Tax=Tardiphaga alba TaxID=340268 RepID=A0ABX8AHG5_9BRAD|nr:DUF2855 family protein [Tardiphaga alba]QUS41760.1 DUF2855 family protein [Tardiphaga alba]